MTHFGRLSRQFRLLETISNLERVMKVKSYMTLILALAVTNSLADEPEAVQDDALTAPTELS